MSRKFTAREASDAKVLEAIRAADQIAVAWDDLRNQLGIVECNIRVLRRWLKTPRLEHIERRAEDISRTLREKSVGSFSVDAAVALRQAWDERNPLDFV